MKFHLQAVLIGENAAFEEYLSKTGLPYAIAGPSERWPENRALTIWLGETTPAFKGKLEALLSAKRFVLAPEHCRPAFGDASAKNIRFFPDNWLEDAPGPEISVIKSFAFGAHQPQEEVAAFPGASVRRRLWGLIKEIYGTQGFYCPRLSFYPRGYRSVFSFRVDADEYDKELFECFFNTAKKYSRSISVFFSMANYADQVSQIRRCSNDGFDIHSHAYTHFTYRSYAQNLFNLRKADQALQRAGIPKRGFSSPYGRWNPGLQKAIDESGYVFSSEFSYNYDDLPSYPVIGGRRSHVLQVPVHPVGLGIYLESTPVYDEKEVQEYYGRLFEQKYEQEEPILFYDHPTKWLGIHPEFMDFLFGLAGVRRDVWICSMSDWAAWWKRRSQVSWDVVQESGADECEIFGDELADEPDGSFEIRLFDSSGQTQVSAPLLSGRRKERFVDLSRERVPSETVFDEGRRCGKKKPGRRLKKAVKDWLDWEKSTPQDEIIRESIPSVIKSSLRIWSDNRRLK